MAGATAWYLPTPSVTTSTSATITAPWIQWNDTITSSTTSAIWTSWVLPVGTAQRGRLPAVVETPEQQAARFASQEAVAAESLRIRQQMHAHHAAAEAVKNAARDKARQLLDAQLDERQRIDLASNGYFELETIQQSGERRRYRIRRGRAGNVHRLDEQGREVRRYCIHPIIACPDEDTMLTQKLWLENNEVLFLRTANAS